jgi:hypothetical protein
LCALLLVGPIIWEWLGNLFGPQKTAAQQSMKD